MMTRRQGLGLLLALGLLGALMLWLSSALDMRTDLSFFLPDHAPTPAAELLADRLRDGPASGLILVALSPPEGTKPDTAALALASDSLVRRFEDSGLFRLVANGRPSLPQADIDLLMRYRYLLAPDLDPADFSIQGLRRSLEQGLRALGGSTGMLVKRTLPADPTNRMLTIAEQWMGAKGPQRIDGVWFSRDGAQALLMVRTKAAGFDLAAQKAVLERMQADFAPLAATGLRMDLTGPSVYAVAASRDIQDESWKLSLTASILVSAILLAAFRSLPMLLVTALPLTTGMVMATIAVQLIYGSVHGITLTFGTTLIGVAEDYPIHLIAHMRRGVAPRATMGEIWPTLRTGVLTTAAGYLAMTFSSFPGLGQLGTFSIVGLLTAAAVTRWVVPGLLPASLARPRKDHWGRWLDAADTSRLLRAPMAALLIVSLGWFALHPGSLWEHDLGKVSPLPEAGKMLDRKLRAEMGAPDVRQLLVIQGGSAEEVLRRSEALAPGLDAQVRDGVMTTYDMAARTLPSEQRQRERQGILPAPDALRANLEQAQAGLPFQTALFAPFLRDVEAARNAKPLGFEEFRASGLGWRVDFLLSEKNGVWSGLILPSGVNDAAALARWAEAQPGLLYLDLKEESEKLVAGYRAEAMTWLSWGALAVLASLFLGLRRPRLVLRVAFPIAVSVLLTAALLTLFGIRLSLFHLVSLLLVAGVGLDYALFFNQPFHDREERERTMRAMLICTMTTVTVFAVMACSSLPVLNSIGSTVALGNILCLIMTCAFAHRPVEGRQPAEMRA